jgi:hypothetical protein
MDGNCRIETAIEVSIEEHADLLIINDMVCRFPGALIQQVEDYSEFLKTTSRAWQTSLFLGTAHTKDSMARGRDLRLR